MQYNTATVMQIVVLLIYLPTYNKKQGWEQGRFCSAVCFIRNEMAQTRGVML